MRLARALWRGQPVDWDGLWTLRGGLLGVTPHRAGGPQVWIAGSLPVSPKRAGEHFDGWLPDAAARVRSARCNSDPVCGRPSMIC